MSARSAQCRCSVARQRQPVRAPDLRHRPAQRRPRSGAPRRSPRRCGSTLYANSAQKRSRTRCGAGLDQPVGALRSPAQAGLDGWGRICKRLELARQLVAGAAQCGPPRPLPNHRGRDRPAPMALELKGCWSAPDCEAPAMGAYLGVSAGPPRCRRKSSISFLPAVEPGPAAGWCDRSRGVTRSAGYNLKDRWLPDRDE